MVEPQGTDLRRWSPAEVRSHGDALTRTFLEAYSEAPYHRGPADAGRFLARLDEQSGLPGFTFVVAGADAAPVGFAFGRHFGSGEWWHGAELLPPAELINVDKFAVSELVVVPAHRGQRLSSRLIAELLRERTEPYAILLSRPGTRARRIYDHWGWRPVGTARAAVRWPAADALVKDLRSKR